MITNCQTSFSQLDMDIHVSLFFAQYLLHCLLLAQQHFISRGFKAHFKQYYVYLPSHQFVWAPIKVSERHCEIYRNEHKTPHYQWAVSEQFTQDFKKSVSPSCTRGQSGLVRSSRLYLWLWTDRQDFESRYPRGKASFIVLVSFSSSLCLLYQQHCEPGRFK